MKGQSYTYKVTVHTKDNVSQDYDLPATATRCLPACSFSANPSKLLFPQGDTTLSWDCKDQNGSPTATSCDLSSNDVPENMRSRLGAVSPSGGETTFTLDKTSTFLLSCSNDEGNILRSTTVQFSRPTRMEIIPR